MSRSQPAPRRTRVRIALASGAVTLGVALTGCGAAATHHREVAVSTPGLPTVHVSAAVRAEEVAIHHEVSRSLAHRAGGAYGAIPADLRAHQQIPADQVLSSSLGQPADPIQGIPVRLSLDNARALAVAVGPHIPERVQGTFDLHTPAYWTVTFSDVHGSFPLPRGAFTLTDQEGRLLHPRVTTMSGAPVPTRVPTGRPFTVRLTSDLISEGDGKLRYDPTPDHLLVEWDFDVETD